jgi:hypothetical protein
MATEVNNPNYRWRPATRGDIGSVARFCNECDDDHSYGILTEILDIPVRDVDGEELYYAFVYVANIRGNGFDKCEIQYDANQEP